MQNKQSNETQEIFENIKGYIEDLEESTDAESKFEGILTLLKTFIGLLEAGSNVTSQQSDMLDSLNKSVQSTMKVAYEFEERIKKLENMITDIASNSMRLAEETAKIPVIDIENLLKTLNEHSDEINKNTASIKVIKDKIN